MGSARGEILDRRHARFERHDGLHAHLFGQVSRTVEDDAAAHHVPCPLRIARNAAGVAAVVELEAESALRFHLFDHACKALMLQFRKGDALLRVLVRHAEVREHALDLKSGQREHAQDLAQALVKMRLVARKAEAAMPVSSLMCTIIFPPSATARSENSFAMS